MNELPSTWLLLYVKDAIKQIPIANKKIKHKEYLSEGPIPVIDQGKELVGGYTDRLDLVANAEKKPVVVFGDHTRTFKYISFPFVAGADGIKVLQPLRSHNPKLFYYFLQAVRFPNKGYSRHYQYLAKSVIPLPPLPEQQRIVAKIEELFTRLDAGVAALKKAKALLKQYRQSVLKAAVEGRLTEKWRRENAERIEPASVLLERIQAERKQRLGKKYKPSKPVDTSNLPEIPDSWVWSNIDSISNEIRYGSSSKTNLDESGIPVLRMGNIVDGELDLAKLKYLPKNHSEFPKLLLKKGDLLFNRTNSVELVGKTTIYNGNPNPCSFASYLIRVSFYKEIVPEFYSYYINSSYGRKWIKNVVSQQVGQANVNGTKLRNFVIPLPSVSEQREIVSVVSEILSQVTNSDETILTELKRSQSLRQSILKRAFEGKLVPQDPADEPANVLLEKIKATKNKQN